MDLYTDVSYELARTLTRRYSTSFSLASRLYAPAIRPSIYAIYGMVRAADEIVDTYDGADQGVQLDGFYDDVVRCLATGYSPNPIIHAFGHTARRFDIGTDLIDPFFTSMRADLTKTSFTQDEYDTYVYGSAEVIGLMCLRVFSPDPARYVVLAPGARQLGSAYQKVNFLRDFASDHDVRGRIYFPGVSYDGFDDAAKTRLIDEITREFDGARASVAQLPLGARRAVGLSYRYYTSLLRELTAMSADDIKHRRAHVAVPRKFGQYVATLVRPAL